MCSAGYYVKVMKKIQDKGDEYIKNENERLGRILGESMKDKLTTLFWELLLSEGCRQESAILKRAV